MKHLVQLVQYTDAGGHYPVPVLRQTDDLTDNRVAQPSQGTPYQTEEEEQKEQGQHASGPSQLALEPLDQGVEQGGSDEGADKGGKKCQ